MLDYEEFERWLEASDDEADVARELVELEAYNAVVLHSEQAAQLALKGLLRGVGQAKEAWGHALAELGDRAETMVGLTLDDDLRHRLGVLQRDYIATRYPDAVVSGTPRGNYSAGDAERAINTFGDLRGAVIIAWDALVAS